MSGRFYLARQEEFTNETNVLDIGTGRRDISRAVESFVFWLKSVPIPEPFDVEKHWRGINRFIEKNGTDRGIETNEHRELLIVRKL